MNIRLNNIKKIDTKQLRELVDILNKDVKLIEQLKINKPITVSGFLSHNKQWISDHHAQIFAIILNNEAIGLISLSNVDYKNLTAKIGYWITSKLWNRGYTSIAFKKILDLAKKQNIKVVSCSITKENIVSQAIWQKFGATFEVTNNTIVPTVNL